MFDMNQINEMMSKATAFQEQLKAQRAKQAIASTSGGGKVNVVVNGNKELTKIDIAPEAAADPEMLSDLILAALNGAYAQVDEANQDQASNLLSGFDLSKIGDMFKS